MRHLAYTIIFFIVVAVNGCSDDSGVIVPQVSSTPITGTITPTTPTNPTNPTTPTAPTDPTTPTTPSNPTTPTDPSAAQYSITFKANGTVVSFTDVSATRGIATNPRTLSVTGTGKNGAVPKFKFFMEETSIGFEKGINIWMKEYSYPTTYVEYTSSANEAYSTMNAKNEIYAFLTDVSYTNGGPIAGTFNGTFINNGVAVQITEGVFKAKFSN
ncbi:hypothetical protein ABDD95_18210 [Mucilaginibacter sp. PAMB04274]|uniref:hypothetical protein n=1 Tax=Mucilaginibacter sp. PAMB04274 TaxID=3138568 RepID=UPI0031F6CE32